MCFRKPADEVILLQRLLETQIVPHSRFAAAKGFPAGPLRAVKFLDDGPGNSEIAANDKTETRRREGNNGSVSIKPKNGMTMALPFSGSPSNKCYSW